MTPSRRSMGSRDARIDIDRPAGPSSLQTLWQRVETHKLLLALFVFAVLTLVTFFSLAVAYRLPNRSLLWAISTMLITAGLAMCVLFLFFEVYICLSEATRDPHSLADLRDRILTRRQNHPATDAASNQPSRRRTPWQIIKASTFPILMFFGMVAGYALVIASSKIFTSLTPYRLQLAVFGVILILVSFASGAVFWFLHVYFADYPLAAWSALRVPRVARRREADRAGEEEEEEEEEEEDSSSRPRGGPGRRDAKEVKDDGSSVRSKGVKIGHRRH